MPLPRLVLPADKKPHEDSKRLFTLTYSLGPGLYALGMTVEQLIIKLRSMTADDSGGFTTMFLTHIKEHLEASKSAGKLNGTDMAPSKFDNVTYYGHGSCPFDPGTDTCLCVYGDDDWCEIC